MARRRSKPPAALPCEAYAGDAPYLFASYAHGDQEHVYPEIARLRRLGYRIWFDEGIRPSNDWTEEVAAALSRCSLFLVFLSPQAIHSRHVLNEVHFALSKGRPVLAVHLAEVSLPDSLQLQLGRIQAVPKFQMDEEQYQRQLARWLPTCLLDAPKEASPVGQPQGPPAPPPRPVHLPSFHYGGVVQPEFFIDRKDELEEATNHVRAGQGFLLVGNRRAGKTSFCFKLIYQIMERAGNDVLAAYLNLQQCAHLTIETFLEHTVLNLIGEMARQVFGCKYSDLLRPDPAERDERLRGDKEFASFVEVVSRIFERTHMRAGAVPSPLLASEFVQFSHDLSHILRARKWRRFLVVYDESNRLPREFSVGLLLSNSETLSAAGLVSVYAASPEMADSFKDLRDVCDQVVPLGPFRSRDDLRRLLERYYFPDDPGPWELPAEVDALDVLWERTRGLPFAIQLLAGQSFRLARDERCSRVTADHVERSCELLRKERPGLLA